MTNSFRIIVDKNFKTFFVCLFLSSSVLSFVQCERQTIAYVKIVYENSSKVVSVHQTDDFEYIPVTAASFGLFDHKINETGWTFLEIHSSSNYSDEDQTYAVGFLEGHLTYELIWMHWLNTKKDFCVGQEKECPKIDQYIEKNYEWMNGMIKEMSQKNPYWYQVKLFLNQLQGLVDGYNDANSISERKLTYKNLLYMNMDGDLEDLIPAVKGVGRSIADAHCSALIKVLPNWADILVSHVTWQGYESMLRIQKKYVLNINILPKSKIMIEGQTMSFSSYPGIIVSIDDFYVISSRLVVLETTIGNSNPSLWTYLSPERQVMDFIRVMVTNRLAATGREWVDTFRKYNSGTYNNQWMVVDYKRFTAGSANGVKRDFLWVLEQIPGMIETRDLTSILKSQQYWPSYNIAYFPNIFKLYGGPESVEKYGDWFTYDKHPRALIFKRDQDNIKDMDGMLAMMTYNDFKHDTLSQCNCTPPYSAENAISARNDLNLANGTYPFKSLGHRGHGGTDVKITNRSLSKQYRFLSVSGPAFNISRGIPPFKWSETDFASTTPHFGHPDIWVFKPVTYKWLNMNE